MSSFFSHIGKFISKEIGQLGKKDLKPLEAGLKPLENSGLKTLEQVGGDLFQHHGDAGQDLGAGLKSELNLAGSFLHDNLQDVLGG